MRKIIYSLLRALSNLKYRTKGFAIGENACISVHCVRKTGGGKIILHKNAQINSGCFFLTAEDITIGENSAIAYNVTILTSANPNYPYNELSKIYPPKHEPVKIGKNCWIGANSVILPGIEIGDNVVVAAGSVVTRNIESNVMVAGNPARIKKYLANAN